MKFTRFLFIAVLALMVASCGGKKSEETTQAGMPELVLTDVDTVAVVDLINAFMTHVKDKDFDYALDMLYESNERDEQGMPIAISQANRDALMEMFKQWNVTGYTIKQISFKDIRDNEVKCAVEIDNAFETKWSFKPMRVGPDWMLSMRSTLDGDRDFNE